MAAFVFCFALCLSLCAPGLGESIHSPLYVQANFSVHVTTNLSNPSKWLMVWQLYIGLVKLVEREQRVAAEL
ncbi:hypothetical protein BRADI_5g12067v3 [Brachypodium distachyon]|uniref:Uncharacterized protein n=1 Tax=Brachypodium distachyon TaxID=15368 RepID=A0A2K2CGQ5_BRADI|nr:hypothetical protein BRADI_5g12067v3 [Brachypodium distachyon]